MQPATQPGPLVKKWRPVDQSRSAAHFGLHVGQHLIGSALYLFSSTFPLVHPTPELNASVVPRERLIKLAEEIGVVMVIRIIVILIVSLRKFPLDFNMLNATQGCERAQLPFDSLFEFGRAHTALAVRDGQFKRMLPFTAKQVGHDVDVVL